MNNIDQLTVGSLFSGIGGLDLGLERAGMRVIWQSEIDPYACRVLAKHWPEVPNHGDIKRINWTDVVRPDVICGGYPCQPFSTAGKRAGEDDPRHLWPWVREAIRLLRPRYAILENVRGHLSLGGTRVLSEITALGYDAEWTIVSAASVGANHRRDRIFIVAYPNRQNEPDVSVNGGRETAVGMVADADNPRGRASRRGAERERQTGQQGRQKLALGGSGRCGSILANADGGRITKCVFNDVSVRQLADSGRSIARNWETEPNVGRVAHGIPSRVDRLKGLGNAVVPQVAETIGQLVRSHYETRI
jgi:DNA (cytosine-5)-methyltransferase 1